MDVDLESLETRVQVLEAVILALVRTSSAPEALLAEFDRAVQRLDAFLAFQERPLAQERLKRHVERVRVQLEPE